VIEAVIRFSLRRRLLVAGLAVLVALIAGWFASRLKLDALPDLSEPQVIVKVDFDGQPPQLVEDQVTYPLAAALTGIAGVREVRAVSMFGEAFVYAIFEDSVSSDMARTRVLERTAQLGARLPQGAALSLGPDASGTGWIYQYALLSRNAATSVERLHALQEFHVKPILQGAEGVAEVASFGGTSRQLQIEVDPQALVALSIGVDQVSAAIRDANQARGGGALEMGRQRFFVTSDAHVRAPDDLLSAPVGTTASGESIRLGQIARANFGPAPREGVADLDGHGDVVGGIVVMRQGTNTQATIEALEARLDVVRQALPADVELRATYDRSRLVHAAVRSLTARLVEEALVVGLVCAMFLGRARSALVAVLTLPIGLAVALALLERQGVTANIMSLGGLAIAIGAMVDAAVVMVETLHRKIATAPGDPAHWSLVLESALEVGPALFFSLLVITISFLPVFSLTGQEGKLFAPLALTKTYAMAAASLLAITLVPVLMGALIRGRVAREHRNPLNRWLKRLYRPALAAALARPRTAFVLATLVAISAAWPASHLAREFMPALDEGDLLYMPTTLPAVSPDEAAEILRITDRAIRDFPEVASVHGKAGRSDSATDPAPLSMIETTILLKPRSQWPEQMTLAELTRRLDEHVRLAGLTNSWGYPIRTRIEMLSTGIKTPLALRITGPDLTHLQRLAVRAETVLQGVAGVRGTFADQPDGGRFVDVALDRTKASLLGVRASDLNQLLDGPVGGAVIDTMTIDRERVPIVVRFPRVNRESPEAIAQLRLRTAGGANVAVGDVARVRIVDGPTEIRSIDGRPVVDVALDLADQDTGGVLSRARAALGAAGVREDGYALQWTGQYLRLEAATTRLIAMSTLTLVLVLGLLAIHLRCARRVAIVVAGLPCAVAGGLWLMYMLGYAWSFASMVGFLALAGVATEFSVVMLLYLDQASMAAGGTSLEAVKCGALLRLRPKAMTVAVILGGLVPLMLADGAGVDVMRRIAAPIIGGMVTAPLFSLLLAPALYLRTFGKAHPRPTSTIARPAPPPASGSARARRTLRLG
jgi:Cu(I)/Ag(I) efflux system membrane protein CusA/SilA